MNFGFATFSQYTYLLDKFYFDSKSDNWIFNLNENWNLL